MYESEYAGMTRTGDVGAGGSKERFWEGEIRRTPSPLNKGPTFSLPSLIGNVCAPNCHAAAVSNANISMHLD